MIDWEKICKGCGQCCGPVPFSEKFLLLNKEKYQENPVDLLGYFPGFVIPSTKSFDCVFLNKLTKKCEIYNERPKVCRLQGTIPELPCPKRTNQ